MSFRWNTFGWINLAIDLSVVVLMLWIAGRTTLRRRDLSRNQIATRLVGTLVAATGVWLFPALLLGGILAVSLMARVCWTMATVGVPILSAWCWRRYAQPIFLLGIVLPLGLKLYGEILEPDHLQIERRQIPIVGLKEPVRVVHLSDLQTDDFRAMHAKIIQAVNNYDPQLVVFSGDLMNHPILTERVIQWMAAVRGRGAAYFVGGDVDRGLPVEEICQRAGYHLLDKRTDNIRLGGKQVCVIGLGLRDFTTPDVLKRLVHQSSDADVRLLLSHRPDAMFAALQEPIDILFAGHTHGGQICLPWGPVVTLSAVPKKIAAGGLHRVRHLWISQSRGLGGEGHIAPRIRLFCRPHLLLIDLVPGGRNSDE